MLGYIREIKRQWQEVYHFIPSRVVDGEPCFDNIPDGDYPMVIEGQLDWVRLEDGKINCCNFDYNQREGILGILQWYGEAVDPHGWEISKRQVAADILLAMGQKTNEPDKTTS
jgi:hypothetical protein